MAMSKKAFTRHSSILLYIPNLIGYARIIFALAAFAVGRSHPYICLSLYLISFICDELDGRAARAFKQTSTFGAVLDMLTDRLATAGLLVLLCLEYPKLYMVFLSLINLDIFSHWLQMYSSLVAGHFSHKETHNQSWLVRQYYMHRLFMGFCCICCETLYLATYMISWRHNSRSKQTVPLEPKEESSIFVVIALGSIPGFLIKQVVNVAQIRAAVSALVLLDLERDRVAHRKGS